MLNNNRGAALLFAMLAMLVLLTLGMTLLDQGTAEAFISANQLRKTQAFYAAEAGIEETLAYFKKELSSITFPWSRTDVVIGTVYPGNIPLKYSIYVENPSGDEQTFTLRSVGQAGNTRYTLRGQATAKKGGKYLNRALTAYGSAGGSVSSFSNNVVVNGDFLINHEYTAANNAVLNGVRYTDSSVGFPEFSPDWYLPAGVTPPPDIIYNRNITSVSYFKTGVDYYYVNGSISLGNNLSLSNVLIEATGPITVGNNASLEGVTLVTANSPITIENNVSMRDVVLVGKDITLSNNAESINVFVYDEGSTTLENNNDFTGIIVTKNKLSLLQNVEVTGSIVCRNIQMENNATLTLTHQTPATPVIPGELVETAVSLDVLDFAVNE